MKRECFVNKLHILQTLTSDTEGHIATPTHIANGMVRNHPVPHSGERQLGLGRCGDCQARGGNNYGRNEGGSESGNRLGYTLVAAA
jgi:hypothetical protein